MQTISLYSSSFIAIGCFAWLPAIATAETELASIGITQGNEDAWAWSTISADGAFVLFESAADNLVPVDTNGVKDLFLRDRAAGTTTRVSVSSAGVQANGGAVSGWLSPNGRFIGWISDATNLVTGDTNATFDSFVRDLATGTTRLVSQSTSGQLGNAPSYEVTVTADGRYAAFWSEASNLVPGDTNGVPDCFVRDLVTGTTERISVGMNGAQADGDSYFPSITPDGRYVVFTSSSTNLVPNDQNGATDVFRLDRFTGAIELASKTPLGTSGNASSNSDAWGIVSEDGQRVVFHSLATDIVPGDTNGTFDSFVHDFANDITIRVSVSENGSQGNAESYLPSISGYGRYVTFSSLASNLIAGDVNGSLDCFRYDLDTGGILCISLGISGIVGNAMSQCAMPSADGKYVTFMSDATDLVASDANGKRDIFVNTDCWVKFAEYGTGKPGSGGFTPHLHGLDGSCSAGGYALEIDQLLGGSFGLLIIGTTTNSLSAFGGTILVGFTPPVNLISLPVAGPTAPGLGSISLPAVDLHPYPSFSVHLQFLCADPGAFQGVSMSQGLTVSSSG